MTDFDYSHSPTGVRIAADFRDNLIIDRYDPAFLMMRAGKIKHLRSENSEDAVTWNVFRSLRQIEPAAWLPMLWSLGLPHLTLDIPKPVTVQLWTAVPPPPSLLLDGDEGNSEIDVVVESPNWVWFIEAKYQSDISTRTTTRPLRDQVLRNRYSATSTWAVITLAQGGSSSLSWFATRAGLLPAWMRSTVTQNSTFPAPFCKITGETASVIWKPLLF